MARTKRRFPTAFAERNRVVIALIGIAGLVAAFFATFYADELPVVGGGARHEAYLAEAAGLRAGDEVRVAGVKVGKVTEVDLVGDKVLVGFRAKGVEIGSESTAAVRIKTLLGQKYLAVDPLGATALEGPIPLERTTTPYDVNAAFSDLSSTIGEIDTVQLEESMTTLAGVFAETPASVRGMVDGLTRLSRTIASRDEDLARLFQATSGVSGSLASRTVEIGNLVDDGNLLLTELASRRESIRQMLRSTTTLARELAGVVRDNQKQLKPALDKLDRVAAMLRRNQQHLSQALEVLGPYYRMLTAALGNGRWVDSYICGLFDANAKPVLDNDVVRDCRPGGAS
ncbi:MCE family protein [Nocardioides nitrophenolicus]|uniref:MCE family protein n=1 Tax=Nocardioides nitrophenolicus TaxID=60489 RepID=UPI001958D316|nr:MCE family protein [Nocardioides nitrophenolicus]MBM7516283.1 phospholipid/cholesterol/gamma-HCH transport system substrate-binding protein [Nocardioides nitrophenolicus]